MKTLVLTIILICVLFIVGCASLRTTAEDISFENLQNAETLRKISGECITAWHIQSGIISGYYGDTLPANIIASMKELDELAEQQEHTDYELGIFLGKKFNVLQAIILEGVGDYLYLIL